MKRSTALLGALFILACATATSQVTNLVINGSSTNFSMTTGDTISWSFDIPTGGTAQAHLWIDINLNHTIETGTDRLVTQFTQTDGETDDHGGPPDGDGVADGSVSLDFPVGLAPGEYVIEFTHDGSGESVYGSILELSPPAFTVSGTIHGPIGADLSYIIVEAQSENNDGGAFWQALTDVNGDYTIGLGPDTSGNPWRVGLNEVPYPYTVSRKDTDVVIDGDITGIDFYFVEAAAQVSGHIYDDTGDTLAGADLYISRMYSSGNTGYNAQADASGAFWFGIPLADLNGDPWQLQQSWSDDEPITTHMLGAAIIAINNGDSLVHDLVAYAVNSTIEGTLQIDGGPPGFEVRLVASNSDSGQSYDMADASTGAFSIPVSDKVYNFDLNPTDLGGGYIRPNVTAHPGQTGVIFNITTTGVGDGPAGIPQGFSLGQNYPNPFNPATTIPYELAERSDVRLTVYDVIGRQVATLVNGMQEPGAKTAIFDAAGLPSGVYTYRLVAKGFTDVKTMTIIR